MNQDMQTWRKLSRKKKRVHASLTVEAALVLPIFLFAVTIFLYFFQFLYIQQSVQTALYQTAGYFSKNAYLLHRLYDTYAPEEDSEIVQISNQLGVTDYIEGNIYRAKFISFLDEKVYGLPLIEGGEYGICIQPQSDYYDDDEVDLCAFYSCRIPVLFFQTGSFECIQRVKAKNWTGQEAACLYTQTENVEEEGDHVYITVNGTRYHTHLDCTHLKLSIHEATYPAVLHLKNKNNKTYRPCESCIRNAILSEGCLVYIADEGDCYHTSGQCSGLKRTINEVAVEDIPEGMTCCKRCSRRDQREAAQTGE